MLAGSKFLSRSCSCELSQLSLVSPSPFVLSSYCNDDRECIWLEHGGLSVPLPSWFWISDLLLSLIKKSRYLNFFV